jgi:Fe2+ transport system protein FeoA
MIIIYKNPLSVKPYDPFLVTISRVLIYNRGMKKISLISVKADRKSRVVEILGGANLKSKLMNMNVYEGGEITKLSHIGLQGPVVIKAGRSILALGHSIAEKIIVEA